MVENVEMKVEKNVLVVRIKLNVEGRPSSSGKTKVIASTRGNVPVPGRPEIKIGINAYMK